MGALSNRIQQAENNRNARPMNDPELCRLQRLLVQQFGGETAQVITLVQQFSKTPTTVSLYSFLANAGITL